jgi:hypothetical protein
MSIEAAQRQQRNDDQADKMSHAAGRIARR